MNQGSLQLTATLSFALQLTIYRVNTVGSHSLRFSFLPIFIIYLFVHHGVFSSIIYDQCHIAVCP